ncbi:DUF3267 domain-containing protein [Enterococcus sp. 5B3_DIV0040]|uniref:DUF3267 domain-containing protein n=1 Tax=Enterococcus sp. 5B3_DIV0040 TaxID=1834182 RepID=UPI000A32D6D6|nr:DUF3267 domain-containing protein [Enterococcus sp. 5B3_DIV0040]OTO01322.1 hypothetical protein A5883_003639 [Enterococcus sp. 5B3_DIV0040]
MEKEVRKLTPQEQKRKKKFDEVCENLAKEGYVKTDLTVSILAANLFAILVMAPFMLLALGVFYLLVPSYDVTFTAWHGVFMFAVAIVLIVLHELIHGLTWGYFAKKHFRSIDFGVIWSMVTPYCTCEEPLKRWQYILGAMMPTLVIGVGLTGYACISHSIFWLCLAELMLLSGGGDFLIIYKILLHKSRGKQAYYYDHPYECGLVVFEKTDAPVFSK